MIVPVGELGCLKTESVLIKSIMDVFIFDGDMTNGVIVNIARQEDFWQPEFVEAYGLDGCCIDIARRCSEVFDFVADN